MKTFAVVAICFLLMPAQEPDIKLEIGSVLKPEFIPRTTNELCMTHPGQLRPFIRHETNKVNYVIAYDDETRKIKYIKTNDEDFKTTEGLQVGKYIDVTRDKVRAYPGWEVRGPANKEGWHPVIGFLDKVTILREGKEEELNIKQTWASNPTERLRVKVLSFSKGGQ